SLVGVGVPSLLMTVSEQPAVDGATGAAAVIGGRSGGLGWWWHTPDDTLDKLDPALLARDARLYAATLFRLCAEPILPFNYAAAAGPCGHDPGRAVPALPLLEASRQLAVAPVGSGAAKFSAVALQRGLNQVVYGLDAALAAVAQGRAVVGVRTED